MPLSRCVCLVGGATNRERCPNTGLTEISLNSSNKPGKNGAPPLGGIIPRYLEQTKKDKRKLLFADPEQGTVRAVCCEHTTQILNALHSRRLAAKTGSETLKQHRFLSEMDEYFVATVSEAAPLPLSCQTAAPRGVGTQTTTDDMWTMGNELYVLFLLALPYIDVLSFTYCVLITTFRAILIKCDDKWAGTGRNIWADNFEGRQVMKFAKLMYTIMPARAFEQLCGGSTPPGEPFSLGWYALIFWPRAWITRHMLDPRRWGLTYRDATAISPIILELSVRVCLGSGAESGIFGLAMDLVYCTAQLKVITDAENPYSNLKVGIIIGIACKLNEATGELEQCFLTADQREKVEALADDDDPVAQAFLGGVLQPVEGLPRGGASAFFLPVTHEEPAILAAAYDRVGRILFDMEPRRWLVSGTGDGGGGIRGAWALVREKHPSGEPVVLAECAAWYDVPFQHGFDSWGHNPKHQTMQCRKHVITLPGYSPMAPLNSILTQLRGMHPRGDHNIRLTKPGDFSKSMVDGVPLQEVLDRHGERIFESSGACAEAHREICKLITKKIIDPKDAMETKPNVPFWWKLFEKYGWGAPATLGKHITSLLRMHNSEIGVF